jgi:hypothetical protein
MSRCTVKACASLISLLVKAMKSMKQIRGKKYVLHSFYPFEWHNNKMNENIEEIHV